MLVVALGLLLLQGPALLHLLLVPHATCEHGELVEGVRPAARRVTAAPPPSWGTPPDPRSDQAQFERSHGDGAGHEHCDALAVRHQIPAVGASIAAASLVWITPIVASGDHAEARPVPLLSLAPKSSPPAA